MDYLDAAQREVVQKHFDEQGHPLVVMYATDWCLYCKQARQYFADQNIAYQKIDVEKSAQARRDYSALQSSGYPLIYVGAERFQGLQTNVIKTAINRIDE